MDDKYGWRDYLWNDVEYPWLMWATILIFFIPMIFVVWHVAVYG